MASSEEGLRRPESLLPSRSVITRSSGVIIPFEILVGEVNTRRGSRRSEMFPSVEATYPRAWIHRPTTQMSRRCSSSVFNAPGDIESAYSGTPEKFRSARSYA